MVAALQQVSIVPLVGLLPWRVARVPPPPLGQDAEWRRCCSGSRAAEARATRLAAATPRVRVA